MIQNREEENKRLEDDLDQCHKDMDHMFEGIKSREKELLEELESMEHKYAVTANLLEIVTERAEAAQAELEKYAKVLLGISLQVPIYSNIFLKDLAGVQSPYKPLKKDLCCQYSRILSLL